MKTKRIQNISILVSIFCTLLFAALQTYANDENLLPLESVSGKTTDIHFKDHLGKILLIDFWASWCGPCRQSFPWMNDMHAKYSDQGLTIIAINVDSERDDANEFLENVPASFLLGFDPEGRSAEQMHVEAMPMSYLIDQQGKIIHRMMGFNTEKKAEHEALIQDLLKTTRASQ